MKIYVVPISWLLFQGDLEQLSIVPDPSLVSKHCSGIRTPIVDPEMMDTVKKIEKKSGKHVVMKIRKDLQNNHV